MKDTLEQIAASLQREGYEPCILSEKLTNEVYYYLTGARHYFYAEDSKLEKFLMGRMDESKNYADMSQIAEEAKEVWRDFEESWCEDTGCDEELDWKEFRFAVEEEEKRFLACYKLLRQEFVGVLAEAKQLRKAGFL